VVPNFERRANGVFGNPYDPSKSVFENRPHAMTAKAMMINTAYRYNWYDADETDANYDITRNVQGWGMPNVQKLYNIGVRGGFLEIIDETTPVTLNGRQLHSVTVPEDAYSLNITLVWRDPMGNPSSEIARINDLGLSAEPDDWSGPGDKRFYHGNLGLVEDPDFSTNWSGGSTVTVPDDRKDNVNTVENIFVHDPQSGRWVIDVRGHEVNEDANPETPEYDVPYALVVSVDFDCDGNGVPDSQEGGPTTGLECPDGGGSTGGGGQPDPKVPGGGGPGTGAQ